MKSKGLAVIIMILLAIIMFTSCKPLSRNNPTDPESLDYVGVHYTGTKGSFSNITDFVFLDSNAYVVNSNSTTLDILYSDGSGPSIDSGSFDTLTSICVVGSDLFMTSNNISNPSSIVKIEISFLASSYTSVTPTAFASFTHRFDKITSNGTNIYVSDNVSNSIHAYAITELSPPSELFTAWNAGGVVTDIECTGTETSTKVYVALQSGDIKVYDASGVPAIPVNTISVGQEIKGIEVSGDIVYVPTATGVHMYSVVTGAKIGTWGDYGEGSGTVNTPALIEILGDAVYISDNSNFKVFEP